MKLKDELAKLPKDIVYYTYESLVYKCKDYDNITRTKMVDEILDIYAKYEDYLYDICTYKELEFLKIIETKELNPNDFKNYEYEIKSLNDKCIFSLVDYKVFDEQKDRVKQALIHYEKDKERKKSESDTLALIIGLVKVNIEFLVKAYTSIVQNITNIKEPTKILGHPLIHFYCDFDYIPFYDSEEEIIYIRTFWEDLEEIRGLRKEYGIAGNLKFDYEDYLNIFYYGFPINKPSVNKMYKALKDKYPLVMYEELIDRARAINDTYVLDTCLADDPKILDLIHEALLDMPCAIYNGYTPKDYEKEKNKEVLLNTKLTIIPQNNANLPRKAADLYYKLYFAILEFVNNKHQIVPELKKIYKQENLDASKLKNIDDYLWNNRELLDDFIQKNEYNFNSEELDIINGFKTAIHGYFLVAGFEREYTLMLDFENHKLYMVKGINSNLDKVIDPKSIPTFIETTLLMFRDNIIFNGFLAQANIGMGNGFTESAIKESSSAMRYYHL